MIYVLIDYDNLPMPITGRGSYYVMDRILNLLPPRLVQAATRAEARFYGGWFEGTRLTRRAQTLSADLAAHFPAPVPLTASAASHTLQVRATLARSLLIDPNRDLVHTFRARAYPQSITCIHPTARGCTNAPCALAPLSVALRSNACPTTGCRVNPRDLFQKDEQKLVDSMMSVDGMYVSQQAGTHLVVVSSDDDLWPPIHSVLAVGRDVFLVHTLPRTTPYAAAARFARGRLWEGQL